MKLSCILLERLIERPLGGVVHLQIMTGNNVQTLPHVTNTQLCSDKKPRLCSTAVYMRKGGPHVLADNMAIGHFITAVCGSLWALSDSSSLSGRVYAL